MVFIIFKFILLRLFADADFISILSVEPERRQWGWLNFVAFWIADSLNVVSHQLIRIS